MNEADEPKPEAKPVPKKPPTPGKVFDIRRPGSVNASATAKPIIVGHKPQVRDSVLVSGSSKKSMLEPVKKVDLKPVEEDKPADEEAPKTDTPPELAEVAAELAKVDAEKPESEPSESEAKDQPDTSDKPEVDEPNAETDRESEAGDDQADDKIDVKPFFVPKKDEEPEPPEAETKEESDDNEKPDAEKDLLAPDSDSEAKEDKPEDSASAQDPLSLAEQIPDLEQTKREGALDMAKISKDELAEANASVTDDKSPVINPHSVVVSKSPGPSVVTFLLWILAVMACLVVIGDVLLDSGVIYSSVPIPHTHFFTK